MPFPVFVLRTPLKSNPNSYYLAKRIFEHIRMNYNKPNANIIGVHTLLKACPNLQKYKEVKYKTRLIIDPFEKDMDKNNDNIQWEYCDKLGSKLSDDKNEKFTFDDFVNSYVKYTIPNYPLEDLKKVIKRRKTTGKKRKKLGG